MIKRCYRDMTILFLQEQISRIIPCFLRAKPTCCDGIPVGTARTTLILDVKFGLGASPACIFRLGLAGTAALHIADSALRFRISEYLRLVHRREPPFQILIPLFVAS